MQPRTSSPPPLKRSRRATSPTRNESNGHASGSGHSLQPLSLSILGVEPLDEFIKEIADFVQHMIKTRPDYPNGKVEVEAKIGVLRDRHTAQRLTLPILVETSTCHFLWNLYMLLIANFNVFLSLFSLVNTSFLPVLAPTGTESRFESNMSIVRSNFSVLIRILFLVIDDIASNNISITTPFSMASKMLRRNLRMSEAQWIITIYT